MLSPFITDKIFYINVFFESAAETVGSFFSEISFTFSEHLLTLLQCLGVKKMITLVLIAKLIFWIPVTVYLVVFLLNDRQITKGKIVLTLPSLFIYYFMLCIFNFKHGNDLVHLYFYGAGFVISILIFCVLGFYYLNK